MEKSGYKHETDKPSAPKEGTQSNEWGCDDFKKEAHDIAFGQASNSGCSSDGGKVKSQFKNYNWTD